MTLKFYGIMTPHNRGAFMLIKNNVTIGIEWRFGIKPDGAINVFHSINEAMNG